MRVDDLIVTVAYFSIPVQLLWSLSLYPRLAMMPSKIIFLLVLFALFIFLCGTGHLMRCLERTESAAFGYINTATAVVSLATAMFLWPLVPSLLSQLDERLESLVRLNKETVESKQKLSTFMSFLCHEIRNPLFAVTSSVTCLAETPLTEEQRVAVLSISDSADLMLRLVNDVLDISKIDAGRLQLEEIATDLHQLFNNVAHCAALQCQHRHGDRVKFEYHAEMTAATRPLPPLVVTDSTRILQIVYNLLSNALKFTETGHIHLDVGRCGATQEAAILRLNETSAQEGDSAKTDLIEAASVTEALVPRESKNNCNSESFSMAIMDACEQGIHKRSMRHSLNMRNGDDNDIVVVRIKVSDTGTGISPQQISRVFEPYSQSKLSDYRKHGGTGLGLSITKGIINAMGGEIVVDSTVDMGTTFVVCLPLRVSRSIAEAAAASSSPDLGSAIFEPEYRPHLAQVESSCETSCTRFKENCQDMDSSAIGRTLCESASSLPSDSPPFLKSTFVPFVVPPNDNMVLIVDDNKINQKILCKMLDRFNLHYTVASDGQEAANTIIHKSRNGNPTSAHLPLYKLVLMDLSMPVMDGWESTKLIRQNNIPVPVIALTANAVSEARERAMKVGATEFFTKPITRNDLHGICQRYVDAICDSSNAPPSVPAVI